MDVEKRMLSELEGTGDQAGRPVSLSLELQEALNHAALRVCTYPGFLDLLGKKVPNSLVSGMGRSEGRDGKDSLQARVRICKAWGDLLRFRAHDACRISRKTARIDFTLRASVSTGGLMKERAAKV